MIVINFKEVNKMNTQMLKIVSVVIGLTFVTAGCADGGLNKQQGGTLLGAAGGGLLGSQFGGGRGQLVFTALGVLGGALLGNQVGQSLDRADQIYANQAASRGLESVPAGQAVTWKNPDNGNHGSFTPTQTYQGSNGYCREYQQTINVGGRVEKGYGKACRDSSGQWRIQ